VRFLIDECLTTDLVSVAGQAGHDARHVAHVGRAGWKDWNVMRYARDGDFVLVTNKASDFRRLYAAQPLHAGLIILLPVVSRELLQKFFRAALDELAVIGEPVNHVLEVDLDGDDVSCSTIYRVVANAGRLNSRFINFSFHPARPPRTGRPSQLPMNITQETLDLVTGALPGPDDALAKTISTATGIVAFDLQAPAKNLYPFVTPIRNTLPRSAAAAARRPTGARSIPSSARASTRWAGSRKASAPARRATTPRTGRRPM